MFREGRTVKQILTTLRLIKKEEDSFQEFRPTSTPRIELDEEVEAELSTIGTVRAIHAPPGSTLVISFDRSPGVEALFAFGGHVERLGYQALVLNPGTELKAVLTNDQAPAPGETTHE